MTFFLLVILTLCQTQEDLLWDLLIGALLALEMLEILAFCYRMIH